MAEGLAVSTRRGVKRNLMSSMDGMSSLTDQSVVNLEQTKRRNVSKARGAKMKKVDDNPYQRHGYHKRYSSEEGKIYRGKVLHPHPSIVQFSVEGEKGADWLHMDMVHCTQICSQGGCGDDHHHCPLCPSDLPTYNSQDETQRHFMKVHTTNSFKFTDHVIVLCNLPCEEHLPSHYHCPCCGSKIVRTLHMRNHLERCTAPSAASSENQAFDDSTPHRKGKLHLRTPGTASIGGEKEETPDVPVQSGASPEKNQLNISALSDTVTKQIILPSDLDTKKPIQLLKIPGQDQYLLIKHTAEAEDGKQAANITFKVEPGIQLNPEEIQEIQVLSEITEDQDHPDYLQDVLSDVQEVIAAEANASKHQAGLPVPTTDVAKPTETSAAEGSHTAGVVMHQAPTHTKEQTHEEAGPHRDGATTVSFSQLKEGPQQTSEQLRHISIVEKVEDLDCRRCDSCCTLFHCPLCPKELYPAKEAKKLQEHIRGHFKCGVGYEGLTSMKCNLPCSSELGTKLGKAHWHCPLCPQKKLHRSRLHEHLRNHMKGKTRVMPHSRGQGRNFGSAKKEDISLDPAEENTDNRGCSLGRAEEELRREVGSCTAHTVMEPPEGSEDIAQETAQEMVTKERKSVTEEDLILHADSGDAACELDDTEDKENATEHVEEQMNVLDNVEDPEAEGANEEKGVVKENVKPQAFQLVAGLLSEKSISTLGSLVKPLIPRLTELTGVAITQEDPETQSYMLQGVWDNLDKTRLIVETLCYQQPKTEEDMENILVEVCKLHPDKFPIHNEMYGDEVMPEEDPNFDTELQENEPPMSDAEELSDIPLINHEEPCPYCLKTFRYRLSLFTHLILKHKLTKKPSHSAELWSPVLTRMNAVNKPDCPSCKKKFKSVLHAKVHYGTYVCTNSSVKFKDAEKPVCNPETNQYECKMCDYKSKTQSVMVQHINYKHKERTLECEKCKKMFSTEKILLSHIKTVHDDKVACQICFKFVKSSKIEEHMKAHRSALTLEETSSDGNTIIKCSKCNYCTSNAQLFSRHMKRNHEEHSRTCGTCSLEFTTLEQYQEHMKTVHDEQPGEPRGFCPVCGKDMLKRNIMAHVRFKHQGVRRYKCPTCGKMFQTKYVLDSHKQTHLLPSQRKYRYICSHCNMGFLNKTMYEEHSRTHSNLRPFHCTICNASFRQKNVYARHMLVHENTKFQCSFCQNIYKTKYSLQQHMKKHSEKKENILFLCICGLTFENNSEFQKHAEQCMGNVGKEINMDQIENISVMTQNPSNQDTVILVQNNNGQLAPELVTAETENPVYVIKPNVTEETLTVPEDLLTVIQSNPGQLTTDSTVIEPTGNFTHVLPNIPLKPEETTDHVLVTKGATGVQIENTAGQQHQDPFLCGYCDMLFDDLELVQTHIITDHRDKFPQDAKELQMTMQQ